MCILASLSDNGLLSALLASSFEIKVHQKLCGLGFSGRQGRGFALGQWPGLWVLSQKYHTVQCVPNKLRDIAFSKLSTFVSSGFVSRGITGFIAASINGYFEMGNFPSSGPPYFLWHDDTLVQMDVSASAWWNCPPSLRHSAHRRPTGMTAAHDDVMGAADFASVISLG